MRNLEQIRAGNALEATRNTTYSGKDSGEVAKKVPTIIRENGIMGALAFALEKKGRNHHFANEGMKLILDAVVKHLSDPAVGKLPKEISDAEKWIDYLANQASSDILREQTSEALAYLGYFRRFANKE